MHTHFVDKLKESCISVLPIMTIVVVLHYTIAPLEPGQLPQFLIGGLAIIIGLSIFLIGADLGMIPFGQRVGAALTKSRSLMFVLLASFLIGFAITIAEPDVQVLATQVNSVIPGIDRKSLLLMIAVGVGLFLLVGIVRIITQVPLRWLFLFFYLCVFLGCAFVEPSFIGIAFDAGGATTGPITVPFIMAMGIGLAHAARTKAGDDSSFGVVGLASIGPIAAVLFMGVFSKGTVSPGEYTLPVIKSGHLLSSFIQAFPQVVHEIASAFLPLVLIFIYFQLRILRLSFRTAKRMVLGMFYTFIGLTIFMLGVNGGFSLAGQSLGMALGAWGSGFILLPIGLLLGAVVVCAEPAVWVLTEQVEEVSGGYIKRSIMLTALSVSIAGAVALGMIRVVSEVSIWWMIVPGYALALLLTRFCPPLFTAIAFDSGGVASGPMSTTFVLSLTLGASRAVGGNPATDAFGMVAMIAMAPLITIQILGLIFQAKASKRLRQGTKSDKKSSEAQLP